MAGEVCLCLTGVGGRMVPISTYSFNRDKAVRIMRGQARLGPSSPKTYSFYRNLLNPDDTV